MGITIERAKAKATLEVALAWAADPSRPVPDRAAEIARFLSKSPTKSIIPAFGSALLAKASHPQVDALALKEGHGPTGYSIRSIGHGVLVPAAVDPSHPFDIANKGPEPLNNQPFFRYEHMTEIDKVKPATRQYLDKVIEYLQGLNELSVEEAREAALASLAAFLRVRIEVRSADVAHDLVDVTFTLQSALTSVVDFLSDRAERPHRLQAVTAALYDVAYGSSRVRSDSLNDPSRSWPGDVQVMAAGRPIIAVEVRYKPVDETSTRIFMDRCVSQRIPRCHFVALAQREPLDRKRYLAEGIERELAVALAESPAELLMLNLAHADCDLSGALTELPQRVAERLVEVRASQESLSRWEDLVRTD